MEGEELVATSAFIENDAHPLFRYSDAAMHRICFLEWPDRTSFVAEFNEYYETHYRGIQRKLPDGNIVANEPGNRNNV